MRPTDTLYRLACTPKDYQRCHALLRREGQEEPHLSWPTVMALRSDELIGLLSTIAHQSAVIAGPILAVSPRPLVTMIRLLEAYERVLVMAGVGVYHFGVALPAQKDWLPVLAKVGFVPYHRDADAVWFSRTLKGG